ncbi:MAG: hypothetical protein R6V44_09260 [Paracoccaceae bacterium]
MAVGVAGPPGDAAVEVGALGGIGPAVADRRTRVRPSRGRLPSGDRFGGAKSLPAPMPKKTADDAEIERFAITDRAFLPLCFA